jgi:hypothetical protein
MRAGLKPPPHQRRLSPGEVEIYLPETVQRAAQMRRFPTHQSENTSAILDDESQIGDLAAALGGRAAKPRKSIVIWAPDGRQTILLQGGGVTEAAEFEDMAHEAFGRAREAMAKNGGRAFDADEEREKLGLPRREDVGVAMAEAFWEDMKQHKASIVTDPAPEPFHNPSPVGKTVHPVADPAAWKE